MAMTGKFKDRDGRIVRTGDTVRIVGMPDLHGLPAETHRAFRHLVGTYRNVRGSDERGNVEIVFRILRSRDRGLHVVGIESGLLHKRG